MWPQVESHSKVIKIKPLFTFYHSFLHLYLSPFSHDCVRQCVCVCECVCEESSLQPSQTPLRLRVTRHDCVRLFTGKLRRFFFFLTVACPKLSPVSRSSLPLPPLWPHRVGSSRPPSHDGVEREQ